MEMNVYRMGVLLSFSSQSCSYARSSKAASAWLWLGLLQALKQEHEQEAIAHSCIISTALPPTNLTQLIYT